MKRFIVVWAVGAVVMPPGATAAMGVKLAVTPLTPCAEVPARIEARPFWPFVGGNRPAKVAYPFKIETVSPRGSVFPIRVRRTQNPYVWAARFAFPSAGRWIVRAANWGPSYRPFPGHRPRITVVVLPAGTGQCSGSQPASEPASCERVLRVPVVAVTRVDVAASSITNRRSDRE